jgi:hypothetical protein
MRLIDIFSGYTATLGAKMMHLTYLIACFLLKLGIINTDNVAQDWLDLLDLWLYTHLSYIIYLFLFEAVFEQKECKFISLLCIIMFYQVMILNTIILHIENANLKKLDFFYV